MSKNNNLVLYFSLLILLLLLILLFQAYNSKCNILKYEKFQNSQSPADIYNEQNVMTNEQDNKYQGFDDTENNYTDVESTTANNVNNDVSCFPRSSLTAKDLLPNDATDTKWANMNPSTGGSINDPNLLTAGWTIGVNSVSNSLRNANLQLRSEPPNPQQPVSPWMISTIGPDTNRKDLEIGSQPYWQDQ
jgi:hypothetical protein